jgi:hypothetical protein
MRQASLVAGGLLVLLLPGQTWANAGYPMILAIWPTAFSLLLPIVLIEALAARRVFKGSFLQGLKLSAAANLASTILGIPLTWYLLALVENRLLSWFPPSTSESTSILSVTIGSPWLMPMDLERDLPWMVPAAGLSLCVPFFFVSVVIEGLAARLILRSSPPRNAWRWAWIANSLSYLLLVACLGTRLFIAL